MNKPASANACLEFFWSDDRTY